MNIQNHIKKAETQLSSLLSVEPSEDEKAEYREIQNNWNSIDEYYDFLVMLEGLASKESDKIDSLRGQTDLTSFPFDEDLIKLFVFWRKLSLLSKTRHK